MFLHPESASGFSTPPTASADTCDSGFTEFFSIKAGTSTQPTPRISQKHTESQKSRDQQRNELPGLYYTRAIIK